MIWLQKNGESGENRFMNIVNLDYSRDNEQNSLVEQNSLDEKPL